jgi:tetratricopeptide (TPR) repeat protein
MVDVKELHTGRMVASDKFCGFAANGSSVQGEYPVTRIQTFTGILCIALLCTVPVTGADTVAPVIDNYNNAVDLAAAGKYDEALAAVDKSLSSDANFTLALATKSGILSAMGRYDEALTAADACIASNPDMVYGYVARAEALVHLDRNEEALGAAEEALDRDPENLEALIILGTAYGNLGMYEKELEVSEEALALYPGDSRVRANQFYAAFMLSGETTEPTPAPLPLFPIFGGIALLGLIRLKRG